MDLALRQLHPLSRRKSLASIRDLGRTTVIDTRAEMAG